MGARDDYLRQVIAGLSPFQKLLLDLDVAVTGVPAERAVSQYHHLPKTLEEWLEQPGGNPVMYLADGGYSRVVFNTETGDLFLTYNSTSKAKENWEKAAKQRQAFQDYCRAEYNRLLREANIQPHFGEGAKAVVDRMLEDDESDVTRYLSTLPERPTGLKSPINKGDWATAPGRIVLHKALHSDEWVTHWENMQTGGYTSGHYFRNDYAGALEDYRERCKKLGVNPDESEVFLESVNEARSPKMKVLKDNRIELDDDERKEVMRRGAVWHHGKDGKPTPAVWKSEVRGKTYYVCNTHRAAQVKPTLKGAIRAFDFIKTTS